MARIFNRWVEVQVKDRVFNIDTHDIEATVSTESSSKQVKGVTGEVILWNLADATMESIKEGEAIRLIAGYRTGDKATLFLGRVDAVSQEHDGADTKTIIEVADATKELVMGAEYSKTFEAGTPIIQIVGDVIVSCNVPIGKLEDPDVSIDQDWTVAGNPMDILQECLTKANGLLKQDKKIDDIDAQGWRCYTGIQEVYFVGPTYNSTTAVVLDDSTGLLKVSRKKKSSNESVTDTGLSETTVQANSVEGYTIQSMIIPGIMIGSRVLLKSTAFTGPLKVESYRHAIDKETFYTELTAVPV